ncbi:MAG TPA: nucleotide exchange factor GrpE [Terriglobales bacterium]|nr:nucleotide exchange factor GrpE [Terriglobales bacterium]
MARGNGKSELDQDVRLDAERELTAGDDSAAAAEVAQEELQRTRAERDALLDRMARLQAEFENARKRSAREQADFRDYALVDAARTLLPILDSLDRALKSSRGGGDEFRSGVELIQRQFSDALAKMGVRPVPAQGEPFDPTLHEAVEMVERSDVPDHQVIEELQRGYRLKDRLLRPAMVRVARNPKG